MTQRVHIRYHSHSIFEQMEGRQLFSGGVEALVGQALVAQTFADERLLPLETDAVSEAETSSSSTGSTEQQIQSRLELVIIDRNVEDYEVLLEDIAAADSSQERTIEVVVLDGNRDGLSQVSEILANFQNLDAVHLISHGDDGQIRLGNSVIDEATLTDNLEIVSQWGAAFTTDGEFLIYGCNLAASEAGQSMVNTLSALTAADVAASDDITGSEARGGDWVLEYQVGAIETSTALFAQTQWQGVLATTGPTINNPGDQTTDEDTSLTFSSGNGNAISLTADPGTVLDVVLDVTDGTLSLSGTSGLTFTSGDGSGDGTMSFSGTVENINTALNGMTFTPVADSTSTSTLSVTVENSVYAELAIDTNLQASFSFDGVDPGTDASPTGANDATVVGAVQASDPERGTVLDFNGSTDYAQISGLMGTPSNITLSVWVNVDAGETLGHLITLGDSVGIGLNSASDQIHGYTFDGSNWYHTGTTDTNYNLAGDGWHHLAYTVDSATNTQTLYLDGNQVAQTFYTHAISWTLGTDTYLGSRDASSPVWAYSGLMDDALIYDRALSATEISALATATPADADSLAVTVNPVNDAPVFYTGTGNFNYLETYGIVPLSGGVNITDVDSANFDGGTLVYRVSANAENEDRLAITDEGPGAGKVNVDGFNIYYSDVLVATYTGDVTGSTPLVVTFNSNADLTAVNEVARNLTYQNTSQDPVASTRTLEAYITDGDGGSSAINSGQVTVIPVNDAPQGIDSAITVTEDTAYTFDLSDFGYTDYENDSLLQVWFDTLPSSGTLLWNGSPFAAGNFVAASDIAAGQLTYQPALNAAGNNLTSFTFRVQDAGGTANGGSDTDTAANSMTINITSVNDTPTGITPNSFSVAENTDTSSGYSLGALSSIDVDSGESFSYSIVGGADASVFSIGGTGADELILTAGVLDFETQPSYQVTVRTTDSGGLTWDETLSVNVSNVNEGPSIDSAAVTNATEDSLYSYTLVASDPDAGSTLSFSAITLPAWLTLTDNGDGTATLSGTPSNDEVGDHSIAIQVSDGSLTDSQAFTLSVTNVNDAPVITSPLGTYPYSEGDGAVTLGAAAAVTDVDSTDFAGGTLVYQITGGAEAEDRLDIRDEGPGAGNVDVNGNNIYYSDVLVATYTGAVTGGTPLVVSFNGNATASVVTQVLNNVTYENTSENPVESTRTLAVYVTDGDGGTSNTVTGYVAVSGVNDAPVMAASASFAIAENNTAVGTVSASDLEGQTLTYSITGGTDQALFSVNSATGELTFISAADFEVPTDGNGDNLYEVEITATDTSGGSSSQQISISVSNLNETPTDLTLSSNTIDENTDASGGVTIGNLSTADPDSGETFVYTLVGGPDQSRISLDGNNLVLTTANVDYENDPSYSVTVQSTDSGGNSFSRTFVISVNDLNEAPAITSSPATSASEDSVYSYLITTTDPDSGSSLSISATSLPDWLTLVDHGDGTATLSGTPENANVGIYAVSLAVSDGALSASQNFSIAVSNSNDAPQIVEVTGPTNGGFDSDLSGWSSSGNIDWANGEVRFGQVGGAAGVISQTLTTQVGETYFLAFDFGDRSATQTQSLLVDITGGGSLYSAEITSGAAENTLQTYVVSFVADSTATTLSFTDSSASHTGVRGYLDNVVLARQSADSATISIQENTTAVTTIEALDVDFGDSRTFSISGGSDQAFFTIDTTTGELRFSNAPDFETPQDADGNNVYIVDVTVQDSAGATDNQTLTINVADSNEAPNTINLSNTAIAENTDTNGGFSVGTLNTSDVDAGDSFTYSIVGGADAGVFSIGGASNDELILTDGVLNFEVQSSYQVVVRTTDSGGLTRDETLTVTVSDVNEGPSIDSTAITNATEDSVYNYTLTASDPDAGSTLSFTAVTLPVWLTLTDHGDGTATLSGTPSNDEVGDHSIEIQVSDGSLTEAQAFTLTVANTNDAPVITSSASVSLPENTTAVTTVIASDLDGDTVSYRISGGADAALFAINSSTGELTFISAPNYEAPADSDGNNLYEIEVTASDGNGGSDVRQLTITVTNVNETPIDLMPNGFSVAENTDTSSGYSLGVLSTADVDSGDSFTYSIVGGADAGVFSIGGASNDELILTDGVLNFENQSSYQVVVRTTDSGGLTRDETLTVTVSDVNEAPSINSAAITNATEDSVYNYTLSASDPDSGAALAFSAVTLPSWLTLTDHGDGTATLSGTPTNNDLGDQSIEIQVSDGSRTYSQAFTLTVAKTIAPIFLGSNNIALPENTTADNAPADNSSAGGTTAPVADNGPNSGEPPTNSPTNTDSQASNEENPATTDAIPASILMVGGNAPHRATVDDESAALAIATNPQQSDSNNFAAGEFKQRADVDNPANKWRAAELAKLSIRTGANAPLTSTQLFTNGDSDPLLENINKMRLELDEDFKQQGQDSVEIEFVTSAAISFTAGVVSWILRGGALLSSLLSSVTVFKKFDPLAIVTAKKDKKDKKDNDDEDTTSTDEVEAMFNKSDPETK